MQTFVIGHKNPDMDAICSAIAYAEFKRATGEPEVVAARCGNTNERIDFALQRFGFEPPVFLTSVQPRVEDVMERRVVTVHAKAPVYETVTHISDRKFRALPVVDDNGCCLGFVSSAKVSRYLFPRHDEVAVAREVDASLADIAAVTGATVVSGPLTDEVRRFVLVVAAMQTDTFQSRMKALDLPRTVLIVGDRQNIQRMAIEAGVRAVMITGGCAAQEAIKRLAQQKSVTILTARHDTATTVLLARCAVNSEHILDEVFTSFAPDAPLDEARRDVAMSSDFAFPVIDNGKLAGIFTKSDFLKPVPRRLILVDHNELTQAVDGADQVPITEIIDHHRIGVAPTETPILFMNRPVGSTCTIVGTLFLQAGLPIPPRLAGLMMCGMISDTLNLTSPTTTDIDRDVMQRLAALCGENPAALAEAIFSVGSPLLTMTPAQAVTADCKEYTERGVKFSVAQIEELSFAAFEEKKSSLLDALEAYRAAHRHAFSALLVTDVNTQDSILLVCGDAAIQRHIDYPEAGDSAWRLDGIVSRKKQLLPYLTGLVARPA
jgi:manganese-dependent inorganic pyrophosphatase